MVFEHFSPEARRAIVIAQELTREAHRRRIYALDLLIALSMVPESESAALLDSHASELQQQRVRRARFARLRGRRPSGHLPLTTEVRQVLRDVGRRARPDVISTSDLVEASAEVAGTSAWFWMMGVRLDPAAVAARGADVGRWEVAGGPQPEGGPADDVGVEVAQDGAAALEVDDPDPAGED